MVQSKYKLDAYNQRDVMGLLPLSTWTEKHEETQKEHNRILQPGFMYRDSSLVLADAKTAKVEWLTDYCCPSAEAAIMLHISKEMVVNYQVEETELNIKAHEVYHLLVTSSEVISDINQKVNKMMMEISANQTEIEADARQMLRTTLRISESDITTEQLEAAKNLIIDAKRRDIMNTLISKKVKDYLRENASQCGLVEKTRYKIGTTNDFAFLGAAGSGKSTIARHYVSDGPDTGPEPKKINKRDCVILATDNYRAFTLPGTESHEQRSTKDVFTRTQDFAYMVKELVQTEIEQVSAVDNVRPNVICDCVTLDSKMRALLGQTNSFISRVAAYRGTPGMVGIAERAHARAQDAGAAPADKGRYVATTALLKGHANASKFLLLGIPENTTTEILDTNVERGDLPVKIATIDSRNHTVEITNLRVMSEFMNKKNVNEKAEHPVELILRQGSLVTDPESKAKAILDMVPGTPPDKSAWSVTLKDGDGNAYALLEPTVPSGGGTVRLKVLDIDLFKKQVDHDASPEAQVLRAITRQTAEATAAAPNSLEERAAKIVSTIDDRINTTQKSREEETLRAAERAAEQRGTEESVRVGDEVVPVQAAVGSRERQIMHKLRLKAQEPDNVITDEEMLKPTL